MIVDSHCHLDFPDFADDLESFVTRAHDAGVGHILTICTHPDRIAATHAILDRFPSVHGAAGVHPHEAGTASAMAMTEADVAALAQHPKIVGIGETGLDFYYDHAPKHVQEAGFRRHCRAARQLGLPVIVHTRDADDDTIRILQDEAGRAVQMGQGQMEQGGDGPHPLTGIIHCFSGGQALADAAVALGFMVSFSGIVTFKRSDEIRAIAQSVPLENLLVETDAPYLAPMPKRGKRNEPSYVVHTARMLAEVKGVSFEDLAAATTANFFRLFSKI